MSGCNIYTIYLILIIIIIPLSISDYEDFTISPIYPNDKYSNSIILKLLKHEGIKKDRNLDYTCVAYDSQYNIVGKGNCFRNILRCLAVSSEHRDEGLTYKIISHLIQ